MGRTMADVLPSIPPEKIENVVRKLERRRSYLANAPHQRRSRRQAVSDAILKLSPATWLAPIILKAHAQYEYKKARKQVMTLYVEYEERRELGIPMSTNSVVALETVLAPVDLEPLPINEVDDPWKLPPAFTPAVEVLRSRGGVTGQRSFFIEHG